MSRGRVEKEKIEFGSDRLCGSCKGKGKKKGLDCWACQGRGVIRKERDVNDTT